VLRYLRLPFEQVVTTVRDLRGKGYSCRNVDSFTVLCEKRLNEVQSYKYLIEVAV
jgi:hypothetical protein